MLHDALLLQYTNQISINNNNENDGIKPFVRPDRILGLPKLVP